VSSICYSPDGKYVASGSWNYTVKLWEVKTGECIRTLSGHTSLVSSICYSPDGKYVASGSWDNTVKLWEVTTGVCVKTLSGHTSGVFSVCYSHDGKYLASGSVDYRIKIWEVATGRSIKTLSGHSSAVNSVCYSSDGKYLASGSVDCRIKIWEAKTGECIKTFTGHTDYVDAVCYSPDGKYLVSSSLDRTIKFWNVGTGELLATTLNLKDGEWLTYTPEGFFVGSEWATKNLVHIVDGMRTVGIDQMYDHLYRPDLVSSKLNGEDISKYAQKVNFASLMQTGSAPIARFLESGDEINNRDVTIEFSIENTGGGIGEVNLLLNGKNIRLYESVPSTSGQTLYFSHTITLQNGKNTLELYAKNKAGKVESLRVSKMLNWNGNVRKPNLYVLTVAVNKYRDRELQLKYAVPDAEAIIKGFESQKKSLYQNILTFNLFDGNVTKEGLKTLFQELSKKVEADDVFVFYIAGHGMTYEDGDYYYLPSDFRYTGSESIAKGGISKNDLTRFLSLIKAGKTLVLLDTCNSGSFLDSSARGLTEKTAIDRLTRSTGHATIAASTDRQSAMEGYEGHGIFTYILVEGLSGKADKDGDGFITLQELSAYAEEEVPRRSYEKWGYEQTPMRDLRKQDFPIYSK
ncbi:MAG: caspase family protein, partial [Treponema sp.]